MHEVALMQQAITIVMDRAGQENANRVRAVRMRVGLDAGVVPDSLLYAFGILTDSTIAQGAELSIEQVPVRCYCPHCRAEFTPLNVFYDCPVCHQPASQVRSGHELEVVSIEVD